MKDSTAIYEYVNIKLALNYIKHVKIIKYS